MSARFTGLLIAASLSTLAACVTKSPPAPPVSLPMPAPAIAAPSPVPAPKPIGVSKPAEKPKSNVVGWVEYVVVNISDSKMKAKLDTGAKISSMRADVIKTFKKDDEQRVLFSIKDDDGEKKIYESKLLRWAEIKEDNGSVTRRPVISMDMCLAGKRLKGEVNLAERTNMNYPVLIGRNMLQDKFILNPGKTFLTKPACKVPAA